MFASPIRFRWAAGWCFITAAVATAAAVGGQSPAPSPSAPGAKSESKAEARDVVLRGNVVPLIEALKVVDPELRPDLEPIADQVVLLGDDRSVVPLIPDEAARALFQDDRLRRRAVVIRGRRIPGLPYLQVVTLKVEHEGRLRTPEYHCQVCAINLRYPQSCPCCQGVLELRLRPDEP